MFTTPSETLLDTLDSILGSRDETRRVIAMASAAVLTASPHGSESQWLEGVQEKLTAHAPRSIILSSRRDASIAAGSAIAEGKEKEEALRLLLDGRGQTDWRS